MKHILKLAALLALFAFPSGAEAAVCFWVGGAGTWSVTNIGGNSGPAAWASGTNGTGGTCGATGGVPKQGADTATFDVSSGSGVVTVDASMNGVTLLSLLTTTYNGTLDFSVSNVSMTMAQITANSTGSPILKLGSGTFTITGANGFDMTSANASSVFSSTNIVMSYSAGGNPGQFVGGGKSYGSLTLTGGRTLGTNNAIGGAGVIGANTFGTLTLNALQRTTLPNNLTQKVTGALVLNGTSSGVIDIENSSQNSTGFSTIDLNSTATVTASWAVFKQIIFTNIPGGAVSGTALFDLGGNTGITFSAPPSGGGGGGHIIGG